jgi:prolipoprotein diacylglyceryltransferase
VTLASIGSPNPAAWRLGPLPVRAYALCVTAGIVVALVVAGRRYRRGGGQRGVILDVAAWAVPFGLIGAAAHALLIATRHDFTHAYRLWHAVTTGVAAIGVPGAVALGAAGAWIACRRSGVRLGPVAGAAAPAVLFGLAIGGLGNWWAQQFYGPPSTWWWAVQISPTHRVPGYENYGTFQPAFLYQSLWDLAAGLVVIWAARRFPLPKARGGTGPPPQAARPAGSAPPEQTLLPKARGGTGGSSPPEQTLSGERTFMLAAACYAAGSFWVESVRIGPLPQVLGVRYGALGDVAVFIAAVAGLYLTRPKPVPPARTSARSAPKALVDDSSGDVMSM